MTTSTNDDIVHIREAYWSAGDRYNFREKFGRVGIGIAVANLSGDGFLTVVCDKPKGVYTIDKSYARTLASQFKSITKAKNTTLAVIPLNAFSEEPETLCGKPHNNAEDTCNECEVIKHNV